MACTAIPISSMYSLSKIEPMNIDPEQIRVAIRVDKSVNAAHGNAQITMGYKAEKAGIDEEHKFDRAGPTRKNKGRTQGSRRNGGQLFTGLVPFAVAPFTEGHEVLRCSYE